MKSIPCVRIKSWYKRKARNVKLYLKPEPVPGVLNNIVQSTPYATSVLRCYYTFFNTIELLWSLGNFDSIMSTLAVATDFNLYKPATERLLDLGKLNSLMVVRF